MPGDPRSFAEQHYAQGVAESLKATFDAMQTKTPPAKKLLCLDFDGVLHSYRSGWKGADVIPDPPVPGAFAFIVEALTRFRVAVYSARSGQPGGIDAMRQWFAERGLPLSAVERLEFPTAKPAAFLTLDDRAQQFTGTFPSLDAIETFQPWKCP